MTIFISYRHDECKYMAITVELALKHRLPEHCVFRDERNLTLGDDLKKVLERAATNCTLMLVLIGPQWVTRKDPSGNLCLYNADDPVRKEIQLALKSRATIIPVNLDEAKQLRIHDLPADISQIAHTWSGRIKWESATQDIRDIIERTVEIYKTSNPTSRTESTCLETIRLDDEVSKNWVRFADPLDADAVYSIAKLHFKDDVILAKAEIAQWMNPGLKFIRVLVRRALLTGTETILGYYTLLPLSEKTFNQLRDEEISERDIRREHLLAWTDPNLHSNYVCAWARVPWSSGGDRLTRDLARNILSICQNNSNAKSVSAWPIIGPSAAIAGRIGLNSTRPPEVGKIFLHTISSADYINLMTETPLGKELCPQGFQDIFGSDN
mgnify:CR=1 FL=1